MSNMGSDSFTAHTSVWPLVILRIGTGYLFLKLGWPKMDYLLEKGKLAAQLNNWVHDMPAHWYPWYKEILINKIIPNADLIAYLVVYGEILVGIALILGLLTRSTLFAALLMNLNYHFAAGYRSGASGIINPIFIFVEIALLFTIVGRAFGIDYYLNKKYPRIPFW